MKASRTIAAALALFVVVGILAVSVQAAPGPQKGKNQTAKPAKPMMPKEIAAVIQEGLTTRQGRQDIPFAFVKTMVLPAQQENLYPVWFFKAKNADLGYAPAASGSGDMEASVNAFFQFFQADETGALKPKFAGKAQSVLTTPGANYDAQKDDWYSFGMALPSGQYTMAFVLASADMKKLSVAYNDVTLPGADVLASSLVPSEPVAVISMDRVDPDQRPTIHRGCFTWGGVKIIANAAGEIAAGQNLEILFFVPGATVKDPAAQQPQYDLQVNFEVQGEDGKAAIKWAPQSYDIYLVNQPLPLFQTVQTMDEKGNVTKTDQKPLGAGKYTLVVNVLDKVSNKKGETKMAFEVK
ncbi:MAG TPA: hypothetical protein P5119_00385 [Candidatus Aminicenantes bacterium]|nr:hypothetical protein [Candidatus Aminicenantes bacterium]HRY63780.1 hypothetical protein [Candidatus Aminicenantes bacterium]HRZ70693.1 hypothetical protein [Candidatus Aminicenantes bacterium]